MSHPHITLPRHQSPSDGPSNFGPAASSTAAYQPTQQRSRPSNTSGSSSSSTARLLKRALKFSQLDFELAVWEMSALLFHPTRVFKPHGRKRRPDPSFAYLIGFFMLLTGLGWGFAYGASVVQVTVVFVLVHFLAAAVGAAAVMYVVVGRILGPGGVRGLPSFWGRNRQRGLFAAQGEGTEGLEFGYCFDVAIRAFFPVWVFLYVVQFVLMPVIAREYWLSLVVGNTLYLAAGGYYTVITFLGYNALPFLKHTELLLAPTAVLVILFVASLFGFSMPRHFAPVLWTGRIGLSHV